MLIILEGTDLAGKSTLAGQLDELARDLGHTVHHLHAGPLLGDPLDEYELTLHHHWRDTVLDPRQLLVIDRWHLGELIYGQVLRQRPRLGACQFTHVERFLDALGAVRVVVDADQETLSRRYATRGEELLTRTQVLDIAAWYQGSAQRHHWRVVHSPAGHQAVLDLVLWAGVENERALRTAPFPGYVGPSWPLLLLVGDEPNGYLPGRLPNPAFMPYWRNSGHYLLEVLDTHVPSWGLANSGDGTDLDGLWRALDKPRVVALGRRAEQRLKAASVPHVYEPHPQWVRRFEHRELNSYGERIRQAGYGVPLRPGPDAPLLPGQDGAA